MMSLRLHTVLFGFDWTFFIQRIFSSSPFIIVQLFLLSPPTCSYMRICTFVFSCLSCLFRMMRCASKVFALSRSVFTRSTREQVISLTRTGNEVLRVRSFARSLEALLEQRGEVKKISKKRREVFGVATLNLIVDLVSNLFFCHYIDRSMLEFALHPFPARSFSVNIYYVLNYSIKCFFAFLYYLEDV